MERSCIDGCGGEDRTEHSLRELGFRLASAAARLMFVASEWAVMVVVRMFDGLFMEGDLLDCGMRSP